MDFVVNLSAFLERIAYSGSRRPNLAVLRAVQQAHLLAVPFENLDIHLGRPISLDVTALFDKIVTRRRGGFCYELNGLLAEMLAALGFGVTRLSAMAAEDGGAFSADFDHLALCVTCPAEPGDAGAAWLVDVGWGNGPRGPLRIAGWEEQAQPHPAGERIFRLNPQDGYLVLEERGARGLQGEGQAGPDDWVRHYRFTLAARSLADFDAMCRYHQTDPGSIFTRQRIATRYTPTGRITLAGMKFIQMEDGRRSERLLEDEAAAQRVLRERFGLVLE